MSHPDFCDILENSAVYDALMDIRNDILVASKELPYESSLKKSLYKICDKLAAEGSRSLQRSGGFRLSLRELQ